MVVVGGALGRALARGPAPPALASVVAEHRWRPSTLHAYDGVFTRWEAHCATRHIDPYGTPPPLLDAMDWLEDRRAAGIINGRTARSQLGALRQYWKLAGADGLQGISEAIATAWSRSAGPAARYLDVPDARFTKSLLARCASEQTPLYERTIVLLRFTELLRGHDVASIVPSSVTFDDASVTFDIRNPKQGDIVLRRRCMANAKRPTLCLVSLLRRVMVLYHYLRPSHPFVATKPYLYDSIFLSSRKPYRPLRSATINHWVAKTFRAIGLDPRFRPHSLRHWGASILAEMGVPTDEILRRGGWSSFKSYSMFYNKALASRKFDVIARMFEHLDAEQHLAEDSDSSSSDSDNDLVANNAARVRAGQEHVRVQQRRRR